MLNVILRRSQGDDELVYVPGIYLANISLTGILLLITAGTKLLLVFISARRTDGADCRPG